MTHLTQGDTVRNINPTSKYHDMVGTYHHELHWTFQGIGDLLEPACDVKYLGQRGPYGYPFIAQRISDLRLVDCYWHEVILCGGTAIISCPIHPEYKVCEKCKDVDCYICAT